MSCSSLNEVYVSKFTAFNCRASMASTVNVMILHVNWQMVNCALVMAPVSVGNVSVMQTGLVRPANVRFLWTAVDPTK